MCGCSGLTDNINNGYDLFMSPNKSLSQYVQYQDCENKANIIYQR